MRHLLPIVLLLGGCQPFLASQLALTDQLDKGVVLMAAAHERHAQAEDQLAQSRRRALDGAFDEDVRQRPGLDADWVIEHRRAYAAALEALAAHDLQRHEGDAADLRTLQAMTAALQRLRHLQQLQLHLLTPEP